MTVDVAYFCGELGEAFSTIYLFQKPVIVVL